LWQPEIKSLEGAIALTWPTDSDVVIPFFSHGNPKNLYFQYLKFKVQYWCWEKQAGINLKFSFLLCIFLEEQRIDKKVILTSSTQVCICQYLFPLCNNFHMLKLNFIKWLVQNKEFVVKSVFHVKVSLSRLSFK